MKKTALTHDSIMQAICSGAGSMTKVAHAHGYVGSVSSDVTRKIRQLCPQAESLMAEVKQGKAIVQHEPKPVVQPAAPPPAVSVPQARVPYSGMYGQVFVRASAAGEVPVHEFVDRVAGEIVADPTCSKLVDRIRSRNGISNDADLVAKVRQAVDWAVAVLGIPNHKSNQRRSRNVAAKRSGKVHIVAI